MTGSALATILSMTGVARWQAAVHKAWDALSFRQALLFVGAVVLLVSGAFGGLEKATPDEFATVKAGKKTTVAPFTMTIDRARWVKRLSSQLTSERGRYLVVVATIRSDEKTAVTSGTLAASMRISGVKGVYSSIDGGKPVAAAKASPRVLVVDDGTRLDAVPGGMTYEVAFVWEQATTAGPPRKVALTLYEHTFRKSSIDDQQSWFDPAVVAKGELPVEEGFA